MDQAGLPAGLQLLAEVADVDLDDLRLAMEGVPPDALEDHTAVEDLIGMLQEEPEQLVLGAGEGYSAVAAPSLAGRGVQPQVGEAPLAPVGRHPAP